MAQGTATRGKVTKPARRPGRKDAAGASSIARPPTSTVPQEIAPGTHWIRVVLDYGTKNQSAAVRIVSRDSPAATDHDIDEPAFLNGLHSTPQIIGFKRLDDGTRQVLWGTQAPMPSNQDHASSATVKQVEQQMHKFDLDIVELTAIHLEHMLPAIRQELESNVKVLLYPDIKRMPIELWISVPQMWEPPACKKMLRAGEKIAKKVGVKWVKLIYEPECATAWHLHSVKNIHVAGYHVGDEIVVCDIGGATGDFTRVIYETDPTDGAQVILRNAGDATGSLCGSELVNEAFRSWLRKGPKRGMSTFRDRCKELGLSEMACLKKASDSFEIAKKNFARANEEAGVVVVRGAPGLKSSVWTIEVTGDDMVNFFRPAISNILRCLQRQCTSKTRKVLVTGGFGRSEYVIAQLKAEFEHGNAHNVQIDATYMGGRADRAVSVGGMLRWPEIESVGFSGEASFGIPTEEIFNKAFHPDAAADKTLIVESPFSNDQVVCNRWLGLVNKDTNRTAGEEFKLQQWQQSTCPVNHEELDIPIYWTKTDIQEHDRIFKGAKEHSGLRDGIEHWDTLTINLPDFAKLGFTAIKLQRDDSRPASVEQHEGDVYEYYWRVTLKGQGANVSFTWELAEAGTQPFDAEGKPLSVEAQLTLPIALSLCSEDFNPFPKSNF